MKLIAFDFDGTLVNNWLITLNSAEEAAEQSGISFTAGDAKALRNKGWINFLRAKRWPILKALKFLRTFSLKLLNTESSDLQIAPQLKQTLLDLYAAGHLLAIVSSSPQHIIMDVIKKEEISHIFYSVKGSLPPWAKNNSLVKLKNSLEPEFTQFIYVGDEIRDFYAAEKSGFTGLGVSWGYQDHALLNKHFKYLSRNVKELRLTIEKL